jgi:hypothetical protein
MDLKKELAKNWCHEGDNTYSMYLSDWCQIELEGFSGGLHIAVISENGDDDRATFVGRHSTVLAFEYVSRLKELYS